MFSSQVGLIYIITPNASNAAVGGSLTQILVFSTEHKRLIYSNRTVSLSAQLYRSICMM